MTNTHVSGTSIKTRL